MFSKLTCLVLLAVLSQTFALSCSDVKPLTSLNVTQLRGKWSVVEWLPLPPDHPPGDTPRPPPRCVDAKVKVDPGHVFLKLKYFLSSEETLTRRCTFGVTAAEPGRWTKQTNATDAHGHEILVLAANPDKFLVLLHCEPGHGSAVLQPVRVCFLSRRASEDHSEEESGEHHEKPEHHVPVTEEELRLLRAEVARVLGKTEIHPDKLHTDCFFH